MKSQLMVSAALLSALVATAAPATAGGGDRGRGPGGSSIVVAVNGVTCTTAAGASAFNARTWQWGAEVTVSTGGGGSGAGRTDVSAVTVSKAFDGCSSALFRMIASGRHIPEVTITQRDADGTVTASLVLTEVFLTSWFVSSTAKAGSPDETVAFTYRQICLSGEGSARVCYDVARNVVS